MNQTKTPKIKRNKLFKLLGCHLKNPRWSWCAISSDNKRAFFTIWKDKIHDGKSQITPTKNTNKNRSGASEQHRISQKVFDEKITAYGIYSVAKDENANPRALKEIDSDDLLCLRLIKEDDIIYAVQTGKKSVWELLKNIDSKTERKNAVDDLSDIPEGNRFPDRAKVVTQVIKRNNRVRAFAIKRAKGNCEHCGERGFETANGRYYVETHHIIALCDSGHDAVDNVIALCPQHHRQAHYGKDAESLEAEFETKLKELNNR